VILFIEATAFPGEGRLQITGQLGDVMRESAAAALSYVKANAGRWGAEDAADWLRSHDIHVHIPAGAIPKDGPSAGIAITTALVSLLTARPVRSDVAMTGEITLTGQVLPIGGLKEKALAAQRAGVRLVLAPKLNEPDLDDFPPNLLKGIEFKFVSHIDQVLPLALEPEKKRARSK
jgi:ATP-dependent Lon protease